MQADGSVRWVTARGRVERDERGRPVRMPGVLVDITERKRLEEELRVRVEQLAEADRRKEELLASLRESEEKLRLLADTIPQLAWMARPDGHIFWYNRRWYEYTGTTPEQMEGWGWQSVHDPDVLPKVLERWKGSIASGEPFDMVFPLKGADDQFRPFLTRVNPLRDEAGRILYWFGTNTDISEIKRMEEALRDADRRKDEFLATLAHELRNPLAPIRNSLQILKMPRVDAETAQQTREMMERQVHHLVRLVDDLLDVSRVMRGKIELRREPVELATVVARAVETAQPLIEVQGHELDISLPPESLLLDADPVRLAQVVGNLLTNAAKYTEANGRIWLTARREGGEAVLSVRDNGIGIAPDMLPHVFELFVQVDHASTKAQGGLGHRPDAGEEPRRDARRHGRGPQRRAGQGQRVRRALAAPACTSTIKIMSSQHVRQTDRAPVAIGPSAAGRGRQPGRRHQPRHAAAVARSRSPGRLSGMAAVEMAKTYRPDADLPGHRNAGDGRLRGRSPNSATAGPGERRPGGADRLGPTRGSPPHGGSRVRPSSRQAARAEGGGEPVGRVEVSLSQNQLLQRNARQL